MSNPFKNKPNNPTQEKKPNKNPFKQKPTAVAPVVPAEETPMWVKALQTLDDGVRGAANGITFGLLDPALESTGLEPNAVANSKKAKENSPYVYGGGYIAGSLAPAAQISKGIGAAGVGMNSLGGAMANQGLTSATQYSIERAAEGEAPSAVGLGASGLLGAGGGAIGRYLSGILSPSARVSRSGEALDDGTKALVRKTMDDAASNGVPLTVPEALSGVAPGKGSPVTALMNRSVSTPKGSQLANAFDESRIAKMRTVGNNLSKSIGPGVDATTASKAAKDAIENAESIVRNSAEPYYKAASQVKVPDAPKSAAVKQASRKVANDPIKMEELREATPNGRVYKRTINYLDAVKKQLNTDYFNAADKAQDPFLAMALKNKTDDLVSAMDNVSPEYTTARSISEEGNKMVERLRNGPLNTIAKTPNVRTQSNSIFGAVNEIDQQAAEAALRRLPPDVQKGLLANHIDSAVSMDPVNFANRALPTDQSVSLAKLVAGDNYQKIGGVIDAARMVNGPIRTPVGQISGGPLNDLWQGVRNYGSDSVVKALQQPKTVDNFGKIGLLEKLLDAGASTTSAKVVAEQERKEKKRKKPLIVNVYPNKD